MNTTFKVNQRVFDFFFGWGIIKEIEKSHLSIYHPNQKENERINS